MKKQHIVVLAATYRPFVPDETVRDSISPVSAPSHYKDRDKISQYVRETTEKRLAGLGELWPLKEFASLSIRYYAGSSPRPESVPEFLFEMESQSRDFSSMLQAFLRRLCGELDKARDAREEVRFLGIGVRDILRILAVRFGPMDIAPVPYQWISEQREIIDPIGLLSTEKTKALEPLFLLRRIGVEMPEEYQPGVSCRQDILVAARFYNRLCRSHTGLTLPV